MVKGLVFMVVALIAANYSAIPDDRGEMVRITKVRMKARIQCARCVRKNLHNFERALRSDRKSRNVMCIIAMFGWFHPDDKDDSMWLIFRLRHFSDPCGDWLSLTLRGAAYHRQSLSRQLSK